MKPATVSGAGPQFIDTAGADHSIRDAKAAERRWPTLDLLRVVAILMTILLHTPSLSGGLPGLRLVQGGLWLGVDLFMLISGWLLGGQLLRSAAIGRFEPLRFYVRRWMRTLPPYYCVLALLFLIPGPFYGGPKPLAMLIEHATFTQVYADRNWYLVSWSLAVEEHFYLLLPLLVLLLIRWPRPVALLSLVIGAEAIGVASRWATYSSSAYIPFATHMRCDGLFIGLALAWVHLHREGWWREAGRWATPLAIAGIVATITVAASLGPPPNRWLYIGAPTIGTWTLGLAFFACVHESSSLSRVDFRGLQYLGGLTYAIYLLFDIIPATWLHAFGGTTSVGGAAWRMALVVGLSIALHHGVERPALFVRDEIMRRWRRAPVVVAAVAEASGSVGSATI